MNWIIKHDKSVDKNVALFPARDSKGDEIYMPDVVKIVTTDEITYDTEIAYCKTKKLYNSTGNTIMVNDNVLSNVPEPELFNLYIDVDIRPLSIIDKVLYNIKRLWNKLWMI